MKCFYLEWCNNKMCNIIFQFLSGSIVIIGVLIEHLRELLSIIFLFRAINDGPIDTYQLKSLDGQMGEFEIPKQGLFQSLQAGALP